MSVNGLNNAQPMQFYPIDSIFFQKCLIDLIIGDFMSNEKWLESLLDDMFESQWSEDIIKREYGRRDDLNSIEDLEPINRFSPQEFDDLKNQQRDFASQIEGFSKKDYEDYLIARAADEIIRDEDFEEMEFKNDYLEGLIREHLDEESQFLDMVMKEAIAEDNHFQNYIEERINQSYTPDFYDDDEFWVVEYPIEKDIFDDLGDTSYMDQGIFKGADTDRIEEPFSYIYYEKPLFDECLLDFSDDSYDESPDFIDIGSEPDDILIEEPPAEDFDELIRQKLIEEKYLDRIFVEIIKRDDYWDDLIRQKLESDEKFNAKIRKNL